MGRILVALDQLINAALGPLFNRLFYGDWRRGPWGHPDETISSVIGKYRYAGMLGEMPVLRLIYRMLNWIDMDHCERSIEWATGWSVYEIEAHHERQHGAAR